jgi:predicted DNA-binding transcriptional regulator YafY
VMKTSLEHARQVVSPAMGTVEQSEEGILFRRAASQLEWIAYFLISLDFPVRVVQPVELRDKLRQIATRALEIAGDP